MIERVEIERFKNIEKAEIRLAKINLLVGGNNSGKSCILQGIHFGVALAQARKIAGFDQFPPEQLRYCPTDDFLNLHFRNKLTEGSNIIARFFEGSGQDEKEASIYLTRGRNGVLKRKRSALACLTR